MCSRAWLLIIGERHLLSKCVRLAVCVPTFAKAQQFAQFISSLACLANRIYRKRKEKEIAWFSAREKQNYDFFFPATSSPPSPGCSRCLKLPGGMLIFRHQSAGQTMCVLFKGYGGIGRAVIFSTCRSFCDSPEGPRPWRAPLAPLRSLIQSAFISLHGNIPSFLHSLFFFFLRPPLLLEIQNS